MAPRKNPKKEAPPIEVKASSSAPSTASMALMWGAFFLTAVIPLILFAVFDWFSLSYAFTGFFPSTTYDMIAQYAAVFGLCLFCWLLYFVRPVPDVKNKELDRIRHLRKRYSVFALPGTILAIAFSYLIAKRGLEAADVALVSTSFWVFGLLIIQVARYVDEFILKNRPDCEACHSPLELVLFIFAAMPGSVFGVVGYGLALYL